MDDNEAERQVHLQQFRDKAQAYAKIFGEPGKPTPYGKIVLDDLDSFCTMWRESIHMTSTGAMCPYTTVYRDGKKAVAQRIHQWLRWRETDGSISSRDPESPDDAGSTT